MYCFKTEEEHSHAIRKGLERLRVSNIKLKLKNVNSYAKYFSTLDIQLKGVLSPQTLIELDIFLKLRSFFLTKNSVDKTSSDRDRPVTPR